VLWTWRTLVIIAIIVAAVMILALGLVVLGLAAAKGDPDTFEFYLDARLRSEVTSGSRDSNVEEQRLRWWFSPPSLTRWEIVSTSEPISRSPDRLTVADGDRIWFYYPEVNAYCSIEDRLKGNVLLSPPFGTPAIVGPSAASSLDELIQSLRDIPVEVVEYSPALPSTPKSSDSVGRLWIDTSRMLILQHTIELTFGDAHQRYESTVLDVTFNQNDEAEVFRFSPPRGAREFTPIGSSCDEGLRQNFGLP
jgi:outer membrane lipoprotein-sorting protein